MNRKLLVTSVVGILGCFPGWCLVDCSQGTAASLAAESEMVLVGHIESIQAVGCLLEDGSTGACPSGLELGVVPDRVVKVKFHVRRVLKGQVGKSVDFLVMVPEFRLVNCQGPGLEPYMQTLAFLKRRGTQLVAWGGDLALYQRTRSDYSATVQEATKALVNSQVQQKCGP